jgi:hypothetical protein
VIRQANNIPQKSVLKAGSTILVPKISASVSRDIAPEVADSATVAYEAERSSSWQNHSQGLQTSLAGQGARAARGSQIQVAPQDQSLTKVAVAAVSPYNLGLKKHNPADVASLLPWPAGARSCNRSPYGVLAR